MKIQPSPTNENTKRKKKKKSIILYIWSQVAFHVAFRFTSQLDSTYDTLIIQLDHFFLMIYIIFEVVIVSLSIY